MRPRRITYTNACRESNSAHIYQRLVNLREKKKSLEVELNGILESWCHEDGPLSQEFKAKKHNYATVCKEIAYYEGKVNYHLEQQQHVEGG